MTIDYFGHPFSSYTWKGEIALIEKHLEYHFRQIGEGNADNDLAMRAIWPLGKFPVLKHGSVELFESSIIVEYADGLTDAGPRLVPDDRAAALQVRLLDRVFDNHVMGPAQAVVAEHLPFLTETPDPARIDRARQSLEAIYRWLDEQLAEREWATDHDFSLADCAAAPALFYADWVHEIAPGYANLRAYRSRLLARPSVVHCVDAARPNRPFFPLGAPDRD